MARPYARTTWVDDSTPVDAAHLNNIEETIELLDDDLAALEAGGAGGPRGWVDVKDYGAAGDGSTDDTAAVNAAIQALLTLGRSVLYFPQGNYRLATGGHVLHDGVKLLGDGIGSTIIVCEANASAFIYGPETQPYTQERGSCEGIWFMGNTGASCVALEIRGSWGYTIRDCNFGNYNGGPGRFTNGAAIWANSSASGHWVEGLTLQQVNIGYCKTAIRFSRATGTTSDAKSFAYLRIDNTNINLGADQTGIDFGGSTGMEVGTYSARINVHYWMDGNNACAFHLKNTCWVNKDVDIDANLESMQGATHTGMVRLKTDSGATSATVFRVRGWFGHDMGTGTVVDSLGGSPKIQVTQLYQGNLDRPGTALDAAAHHDHAGVGFSVSANRVTTHLWGYSNANSPAVVVSRRPFATNPGAAFDADANAIGFFSWDGTRPYFALGTPTTHVRILTGTGTPEGVVTAPVGSLFLRQDGAATTTLYVKTSGTGNTGWTAK